MCNLPSIFRQEKEIKAYTLRKIKRNQTVFVHRRYDAYVEKCEGIYKKGSETND